MIQYIENRIWRLAASISSYEIETVSSELKLIDIHNFFDPSGKAIINKGTLATSNFARDGEHDKLQIDFNQNALNSFQRHFENITNWKLKTFFIIITEFGYLNIVALFEITDKNDINEFETIGINISNGINDLFSVVDSIVNTLHQKKFIEKSKNYHFGIPEVLKSGKMHSIWNTYNFNQHLFIEDNDEVDATGIKASFGLSQQPLILKDFEVYVKWSLFFWFSKKPVPYEQIVLAICTDSLHLAQSNLCASSISCYTTLLELAGKRERKVNSDLLRTLFHVNNATLQRLRLYERELTEAQHQCFVLQKSYADLDKEIEFYRSSEKSLLIAVEGIEAKDAQNTSRVIQFILFCFTALSIYSVTSDILTFLSNRDGIYIDIYSTRTLIFSGITVIVGVMSLATLIKFWKS